MILQAFLIALVTWLMYWAESWFAYPMINCPLVLCPVVGLICGDLTAGVMMGASMQLVFLGVMGIGGTIPQAADLGSIVGTAFAIWQGADVEVALAFAVPVSLIGSTLTFLGYFIRTMFTPLTARLVEKGDMRALDAEQFLLALLPDLPKYIIVFVVLAFGNGFAEWLINNLPQVLLDGMNYATGLMPAVGIALLLKTMWNKNIAIYFFLGAILATYFGQSTVSVALVGCVIAGFVFMNEKNKQNEEKPAPAAAVEAVDDGGLFDD